MRYPNLVDTKDNTCYWYENINTPEQLIGHFTSTHLMQFTGLTDKNGKEIYEGDICKAKKFMFSGYKHDGTEEYEDFIGEVTFDDYAFFVGELPFMGIDKSTFEIIGNIYQHPELLTK